MSERNLAWTRRSLEHFKSTGTPYLEDVASDVEVFDHDIPDARNPYVGHEGVVEWLADFAESWNSWEMDTEQFLDAGDRVVTLVRIHAEGAASGVKVERGDAIVWTFRDGLLARIDYFNSHAAGLEAAGLADA